jgi:hypothetical protein
MQRKNNGSGEKGSAGLKQARARAQQKASDLPGLFQSRLIAFSSEVRSGSRKENASKQKIRASVLIQSEPKWL